MGNKMISVYPIIAESPLGQALSKKWARLLLSFSFSRSRPRIRLVGLSAVLLVYFYHFSLSDPLFFFLSIIFINVLSCRKARSLWSGPFWSFLFPIKE
jgi:hypothetical protein